MLNKCIVNFEKRDVIKVILFFNVVFFCRNVVGFLFIVWIVSREVWFIIFIYVMYLEVFNKRKFLVLRNDIRKEIEVFMFLYLVFFCVELFRVLNFSYF